MSELSIESMLSNLGFNEDLTESFANDSKAQLWLEKQQAKKWYEDRIEGLPGDDYIQRCIRMVDWWMKETAPPEQVVRKFLEFTRDYTTDSEGYNCNQNAESDIQDLKSYIQTELQHSPGGEGWRELTQAVAECAVGLLIEINEEISESVETQDLRLHFTSVSEFWNSFYDSAFINREADNDPTQMQESHHAQVDKPSDLSEKSAEEISGGNDEINVFNQCCQEAVDAIIAGLNNPAHPLNSVGGFSKIPEDFKFLGMIGLGLESGHLSREGLLLYSCLNGYCMQLLRKFFIIQRNQNLEARSIEPSDHIQKLIDESSDQIHASIQAEILKQATEYFHSLQDFQKSSPAAFRVSFENQLPEALDMAFATLRDAIERAKELEASNGIREPETLAAIMLAYSPMDLSEYENRFSQAPWGFYELSNLCSQVLENVVERPRELLGEIFSEWQAFNGTESTESQDDVGSADQEGTTATGFLATEEDMKDAFGEFTRFLFDVLKNDSQLQERLRSKTTIEVLGFIRSEGYMQNLTTREDLVKFFMSYDIDGLLQEAFSAFATSPTKCQEDEPATSTSPECSSNQPLIGSALANKVRSLSNESPESQARQCGYLIRGQPGQGDVEAYYAALYEAYRAERK